MHGVDMMNQKTIHSSLRLLVRRSGESPRGMGAYMCTAPISRLCTLAQWRGGARGGERSGSSPLDRCTRSRKIFDFRKEKKKIKTYLIAEAGLDPATVGYEPSTLSTAPLRCRSTISDINPMSIITGQPRSLDGSRRSSPYIASSLSLSLSPALPSRALCALRTRSCRLLKLSTPPVAS